MKKSLLLLFLLCTNLLFAQEKTQIDSFWGFELGQFGRMVETLLHMHEVEYVVEDNLETEGTIVRGKSILLDGVTFDKCTFLLSDNELRYTVFVKTDSQDVLQNAFAKLKGVLIKKYGEGTTGETENVWAYNIGNDYVVLSLISTSFDDEEIDDLKFSLSLSFQRVDE